MQEAPVIGHGTGSVKAKFAEVTASEKSSERPTVNPHNQTFMVGIQLGFHRCAGAVCDVDMRTSRCLCVGRASYRWIGLAVVAQNVIGGLFNTHLFDVVQGWTYFFGVGAAGRLDAASSRATWRRRRWRPVKLPA